MPTNDIEIQIYSYAGLYMYISFILNENVISLENLESKRMLEFKSIKRFFICFLCHVIVVFNISSDISALLNIPSDFICDTCKQLYMYSLHADEIIRRTYFFMEVG